VAGWLAGVIRDGDWNIAQKWLEITGSKRIEREDMGPDALNWVNADDYWMRQRSTSQAIQSAQSRQNGKPTGEPSKSPSMPCHLDSRRRKHRETEGRTCPDRFD